MARTFHTLLAAILLLGLSTGALFAQPGEAPPRNGFEVTEPLKLDLSRLEANRARLASGDNSLRPALDRLLARAERLTGRA